MGSSKVDDETTSAIQTLHLSFMCHI